MRMMETEFERVPALFVEMYRAQFEVWGREYRVRGRKCAIVFSRRPGAPVLLDAEGRAIMHGAWLTAEVDSSVGERPRMVIKPASEQDAELIARHVREMRGQALQ